MTDDAVDVELTQQLSDNAGLLRDPDVVMTPARLGAVRLTRYAFSRSVLRRAHAQGWETSIVRFDLDVEGQGEVAYRVDAEGHVFHFVAFLQALPESAHTDRVIADRWEIAAALIEGDLTEVMWAHLRQNVPEQERGRLGPDVLTLTRGNRSVRFFTYLVDVLAAGHQPEPDLVGDAGYIMRSTAFYGNGKFGMRSFHGYPEGHPLAAPYRAQFLAAWCYRELSYDAVEHCARLRGGEQAVSFGEGWRTFFGLGNATGLGLVPYAFKHPKIINAWVAIRELALVRVRSLDGTASNTEKFRSWVRWAEAHYRTGTTDDATPFLSPAQLVPVVENIAEAFERVVRDEKPFEALMRWAMDQDEETGELVVSLLLELDDWDDETVDRLLSVSESADLELSMSVSDARQLVEERFGWALSSGLGASRVATKWWVYSDNTEEPRRIQRDLLPVGAQDMGIDIATRMAALHTELLSWPAESYLGEIAATQPHHVHAIERLFASDQPYGEPRDNSCADEYLPLQIQRFQLAQYGMDNFKPKSTDWLRVTLFQGAPRFGDIGVGTGEFADDWVLPPLPTTPDAEVRA